MAGASWQYAPLAQNSYWQSAEGSARTATRPIVLPPAIKERHASIDDRYAYAYSLFDRFDDAGRLREVILAYRRTSWPKDWWHGTPLGRQGPRGLVTYRQERAGLDTAGYGDVPVALAGHSLGGRIADHVLKRVERDEGGMPSTLSSYQFGRGRRRLGALAAGRKGPVQVAISESGEIAGRVPAGGHGGSGLGR
ncbi:MAG TPA: hypothetical protein VHN58_01730 [Croceicoccus sp.]|nr:hypothetical protein [Croceicoccus sp.]